MNKSIISLQETAADFWVASYQGNYGIYTIKIKVVDNKTSFFSCSCPSDGYPCKHIGMIRTAIDERKANKAFNSQKESQEITIKQLIDKVSEKELRSFIIDYARYNEDLSKKIQLTFLNKLANQKERTYNIILAKELKKIHFDIEDIYDEYEDGNIEIEILDNWLTKASEKINAKEFIEAIAIAKACLEEYASWSKNADEEVLEYLDSNYQEGPFEIFKSAALEDRNIAAELFEYCFEEQENEKYADTYLFNEFQDLLGTLAQTELQKQKFIKLQDQLLKQIEDKNSNDAEAIITRKIDFYHLNNLNDQAHQLIEDNIQFHKFRKIIVEEKIGSKDFEAAKQLITDALSESINNNYHVVREWEEILMSIAQIEQDIPTIRSISFKFIDDNYSEKYYLIYKNTFSKREWLNQKESLINNYQKNNKSFIENVARVFVVENEQERLLNYVKQYFTLSRLQNYYIHFCKQFPSETLSLFEHAIYEYAADNTGRNHYEYIVHTFRKMCKIKDGSTMARSMSNQFKLTYKNRPAMIETLYKAGF